jgi:hypothetical protein
LCYFRLRRPKKHALALGSLEITQSVRERQSPVRSTTGMRTRCRECGRSGPLAFNRGGRRCRRERAASVGPIAPQAFAMICGSGSAAIKLPALPSAMARPAPARPRWRGPRQVKLAERPRYCRSRPLRAYINDPGGRHVRSWNIGPVSALGLCWRRRLNCEKALI